VAALLAVGCATASRIRDRPISFSEWRQEATRTYIAEHYEREVVEISIEPRIIVLHWTAIDDLEETLVRFDPEALPELRSDLGGTDQVNVSSQFLIDRNGTIYRLMPETWMARHTIGLNLSAIGIENVGGGGGVDNLTDGQIKSNIRLVRYLKSKYPSIDYLIGHSEYREFEGHRLWLEVDDSYRTEKIDPGDRVMSAVRKAVADLGLKGVDEVRVKRKGAR
jgi:N-acetyl-anhydromuramyl-L-alanine amidase AmpD